jgi:transposase-like protein
MVTMHKFRRDADHKLRVLQHADRIGDIGKACRYFGVGRASFYRWRTAYRQYGLAGLENRKTAPKNPANRTAPEIVEKVLHLRTTYRLGPIRIVWYLARYHAITISDAGVYRILRRNGLSRLPGGTRVRKIHTQRYQKQVPGHQIQVDVKFLKFEGKDGKPVKRYQYTGVHSTGYAGHRRLAERGDVRLAFCWVHVRRNFYKLATPGPAPIASEALQRIAVLYAVEKAIRGRSADERRIVRQQRCRPLIDALEAWLRIKLGLISQKGKLAEAINYALSRWEGLTRFLDDGRIELDNNTVERSIRPITLNRKNALFAGSDGGAEHWATIATLIETCKLNDIDPLGNLKDVLARIVNGHPNRE